MAEASSTDDVITLRIRFKSETLERFIERYGGDLGPDEVFVRTRQPLSPGTPIAFEFTLNDGSPLISGRGVVAWGRSENDPGGPPGMGVRFTSLPTSSWQVLRRVLTATGRNDPNLAAGFRRGTPLGPPAVGGPPARDDNEATEVARMPPTFFEPADNSRHLERTREVPRLRDTPIGGTPPRGSGQVRVRTTPPRGSGGAARRGPIAPEEAIENLGVEDMEELTPPPSAQDPRKSTLLSGGAVPPASPAAHGRQGATEAIPWRAPSPPAGVPLQTAATARNANAAGARGAGFWSTDPVARSPKTLEYGAQGVDSGGAYRDDYGDVDPREAEGPPIDHALSTAPTLPATAAVLLYDPDDPNSALVPAETPQGRGGPAPGGIATTASPVLPSTQPQPGAPYLSNYGSLGGVDDAYGDRYETNYEPRATSTGGRSPVGRIGPAISPEEMALASSAVQGLEGETPMWPGVAEEPVRVGSFRILVWLGLVLAASAVIGAVLWLVPLFWSGLPATLPVGNEAPVPEVVAPPAAQPTAEPSEPAAAPGVPPPAATPPAAAAPATPPAAPSPVPSQPAPAAAKPAEAPPAAAAPSASKPGRAEAEPEKPAPRPRRRIRRDPNEIIAEADVRAGRTEPAPAASSEPATPPAPLPTAPPSTVPPPASAPAPAGGVVPGAAAVTPPPAADGTEDVYWLSVRSTPPGADVLIDGQVEGKTPFQRRIFDPSRSYVLIVRRPGYTTVERTVSGGSEWSRRGNVRTLSVTAKLEPIPGAEEAQPSPPTTPPPTAPGKINPFDEPPPPSPKP